MLQEKPTLKHSPRIGGLPWYNKLVDWFTFAWCLYINIIMSMGTDRVWETLIIYNLYIYKAAQTLVYNYA